MDAASPNAAEVAFDAVVAQEIPCVMLGHTAAERVSVRVSAAHRADIKGRINVVFVFITVVFVFACAFAVGVLVDGATFDDGVVGRESANSVGYFGC